MKVAPPRSDDRPAAAPKSEDPAQVRARSSSRRAPAWIALLPGLAALTICLLQLSSGARWSGVAGYDDGVYVGSAVELARGVLPYKDFVFVQPPGLTVLVAPLALFARLLGWGTQDVLAMARLLTAFVTAGCAVLISLSVRRHGALAMLVAGLGLACYPSAFQADNSAYLEPYLVFFVLLGMLLLFRDGAIGPRSAPYLAGLSFGLAADFKLWAVLPAGLALGCLAWVRREWRSPARFVGGAATGLAAVIGPFFVVAPRAFLHDTLQSQVARLSFPGLREMAIHVNWMFGFEPLGLQWWGTVLALLVVGAFLILGLSRGVRFAMFEWYCLVMAVVVTVILVLVNPFYPHYAFFLAPFLVILGATVVARAARAADGRSVGRAVAVTLVATVGIATFASYQSFQGLLASGDSVGASTTIRDLGLLPHNACVVTDETSYLLVSNRLTSQPPGCPALIDPFGIKLEEQAVTSGAGLRRANGILSAEWRGWFKSADYVLLTRDFRLRVLWNIPVRRWFHWRYAVVAQDKGATLFGRRRSPVFRHECQVKHPGNCPVRH